MKTTHYIFFALLLSLIAGCEKKADEHGNQTLMGKLAAEEELMCFHTQHGWMQRDTTGRERFCNEAAEMGDVNAQYSLGIINYESDKSESAKWYRMAAEQGQRRSQLLLGIMYIDGEGVPKDLVSAYMWISLARDAVKYLPKEDLSEIEKIKYMENTIGLEAQFVEIMTPIEKQMTTSQIAEAQKLAKDCDARNFKWC